jgi:membrane-anchored mycosin MYCP
LSASAVARRLLATATPAPGPASQYGAGVVNPYRAVRDALGTSKAAALPVVRPKVVDAEAERRAAAWQDAGSLARRIAVATAIGAVVLLIAAVVFPLGRRRRWRAG